MVVMVLNCAQLCSTVLNSAQHASLMLWAFSMFISIMSAILISWPINHRLDCRLRVTCLRTSMFRCSIVCLQVGTDVGAVVMRAVARQPSYKECWPLAISASYLRLI